MALLHVALQEGFSGDLVVIRLNGREVFRKSDVKTRLQTGYAGAVEEDVAEGPVTVDVELPQKGAFQPLTVDVRGPTYLGISLTQDNRIAHKVSREPFGYV